MKFKPQFIAFVAILFVVAVLAALVLAGVISVPSMPSVFGPSRDVIAANVKSLYELSNPGTTIEVAAVTEQYGLYKIIMRASDTTGTTYREVYTTKDGRLLTENMIFVEESIAQIAKYRDFVDCLNGKGVRIAGVTNQTATMLQLNVLGAYSPKLFVACEANLNACIAANVTQVPSVVIGQYVDPGVKSVDWFERVTGCKL